MFLYNSNILSCYRSQIYSEAFPTNVHDLFLISFFYAFVCLKGPHLCY